MRAGGLSAVGGEAHFNSLGYVTGVYGGGVTPYHDSSNALYYDLGDGTGSGGYNMRVTTDEFRAVREGDSEAIRALTTMKALKDRLAQAGSAPDTFGKGDNNGWMNLYVDRANYQRSNGLLLHIDTGYRSAGQRWSAEDLSAKLVDFKAHDSFVAHYGDAPVSFGRYDLVAVTEQAPVQAAGDILQSEGKESVVVRIPDDKLRPTPEDDKKHKQKE